MRRLRIVHICDKFGMAGSTIHGASRLFSWWMPRFDRTRFDVSLYALKKPDFARVNQQLDDATRRLEQIAQTLRDVRRGKA